LRNGFHGGVVGYDAKDILAASIVSANADVRRSTKNQSCHGSKQKPRIRADEGRSWNEIGTAADTLTEQVANDFIHITRNYYDQEEHKIKAYELRHMRKHHCVLIHCEKGFKKATLPPLEPNGKIAAWYKRSWF